ncbi:MAG TPA: ATP-binding protein [Desulfotignum sp.]|nr:ATP-binding protein [Desulfotignum sp.]
MNFFNHLTLKNKIFFTCLGFVLLVSVLIALFTRALLISSLTSGLKDRGVGIAQSIADSARVFILTENRIELTAIAYDARLGNRKDFVSYLVISDKDKQILGHTFTTGFFPGIREVIQQRNPDILFIDSLDQHGYSVFHVSVPVKEGIYTIGAVHVGLDKKHIENLIAKLRLIFLSFLSVITVIFFFLSHRLALHITKPISSLIRYTDQITKGDFNILPDKGSARLLTLGSPEKEDDIARLTDSFIKMTCQLKESTDRLKESQKKYRSLFRSGPNPIFVVEKASFKILDANPNAIELFGYELQELIGMKLFDLAKRGQDHFSTDPERAQAMIGSSKAAFCKKDGTGVFVNIHTSPSKYRDEDVIIVGTTDISELVEKDSQLIQASKMANLEKMSAGIAHEISQPLNAIKMGSEYLCMMQEKNRAVDQDDLYMVLTQISTQVTRAAEIVGRLKTFSRKTGFTSEIISINDCIHAVNKIIGRQITLQNIALVLDLDTCLPRVLAHQNRIEQVIFNLVTNARDAVNEKIETMTDDQKGHILIHTFSDHSNAVLEITDNGIGIAPERMNSIFESFYTTKEMGEGLGLGLPIIQGIVKDYKGTISVKSTPGKGTCFQIIFPAHHKGAENENNCYR